MIRPKMVEETKLPLDAQRFGLFGQLSKLSKTVREKNKQDLKNIYAVKSELSQNRIWIANILFLNHE